MILTNLFTSISDVKPKEVWMSEGKWRERHRPSFYTIRQTTQGRHLLRFLDTLSSQVLRASSHLHREGRGLLYHKNVFNLGLLTREGFIVFREALGPANVSMIAHLKLGISMYHDDWLYYTANGSTIFGGLKRLEILDIAGILRKSENLEKAHKKACLRNLVTIRGNNRCAGPLLFQYMHENPGLDVLMVGTWYEYRRKLRAKRGGIHEPIQHVCLLYDHQ